MKNMIGCNYWGSRHGTDMWKYWDEESVRRDIREIARYGVTHLRVFPNWRDFQPIYLVQKWRSQIQEYRFANDRKIDNEYGIDFECIEHFRTFCKIAQEHGIGLIVSIVTGWMSGRMFVPPALERLNHITDAESLMWQTRFVRGFVKHLKSEPAIVAWDLGNECNCMGPCDDGAQAYMWTAAIRNAILSEDQTRMIMSGMHGLGIYREAAWTIQDQGELTDVLTPHPYPSPTVGGDIEPMNSLRTTLIPTAQVVLYSSIGHKPAMMQETGTFNNIVGNEKTAADFLRVNILSGWANGSMGYLWWCAHDQKHLKHLPYSLSMNENELGLLREDYTPKKNALEMKRISDVLSNLPFPELPAAQVDAVCLIPNALPNYFHIAEAAYVLGKQAGINVIFTTCEQPLPDAPIYIVPSMSGWSPITQDIYLQLMARAEAGANVYFSTDNGFITDIENCVGLESLGMVNSGELREADFGSFKVPFSYGRKFLLRSVGAEVLCSDDDGTVIFSKVRKGRGCVYFLNFPLEDFVWNRTNSFTDQPYYRIYQMVAQDTLDRKPVTSGRPDIALTLHPLDDRRYIVAAINYSAGELPLDITLKGCSISNIFYGDAKTVAACDANVFEVTIEQAY